MASLAIIKPYLATASPPGAGCIALGAGATPAGGGDPFPNDGRTILRFTNTNAATRTVTIAPVTASPATYLTYKTWAFIIPVTTGDLVTRTFETSIYNNASGEVAMTYDAVTNVLVWCISANGG